MKTVNELRDETEKARIANFAKWTESTLTERINNAVKKGAYSFTTDVRNLSIPIGYGWEDVTMKLPDLHYKIWQINLKKTRNKPEKFLAFFINILINKTR